MKKKLTALGVTCGIGSMLGAARQAGFEVIGNVEWRKYYHKKDSDGKNTFRENFPEAFFHDKYPQVHPEFWVDVPQADIVYGHPECGSFSALNFSNKNYLAKQAGCADIPLFLDAIAALKPRYFVMDDLPRSFIGLPMSEYHMRLPEYDLFPEWISNYHYGNVQLNRKRMFMLGSLKSERWAFQPGEFEHDKTIKDIIGDLLKKEGKFPNHWKHTLSDGCGKIADFFHYGYRGTWKDFQTAMAARPEGPPIPYIKQDGSEGVRMGTAKVRWEGHGFVLDGGSVCTHPVRNLPLSIRERARIQGFPDDFIFYSEKLDKSKCWNHDKNNDLVKQTGKAMPWQFNRYVGEQIIAHINKEKFECSGERLIEPNGFVTDAKKWYCENVGYANQKAVCNACWCKTHCTLERFAGDKPADQPVKMAIKQPRTPSIRLKSSPKVVTRTVAEGTVFSSFGD